MTAAYWACARCHATEGRKNSSRLCRACLARLEASGQLWCCGCQRAVSSLTCLKVCKGCASAYWRRANVKRRPQPPEGWLSVPELARRLHFSPSAIVRWLNQGWMRGERWQVQPHSPWYLPDRASYPPPPSKRRKELI